MSFSFLMNKRGNVMPYVVVLIGFVAMPMMLLSVEITRAMYVDSHLQTATDTACAASVQAINTSQFINTGLLQVDITQGRNFAHREFNATVIDKDLKQYNPILISVERISDRVVACEASATLQWILPGLPALTLRASSTSELQAVRY